MNDKLDWCKKHFVFVLIVAVIIAMTISILIGMAQSVWFDEAYSISLAKQPVAAILHLTSVDTHPPLFYLLLSLWGNIFGWSELALRMLSVLFMGGAVIFAGLFTRKAFGTRAALITLPFIIFAPLFLRYGFEIRMYSLAALIGIAATYVLISAVEARKKDKTIILYIAYAILVAVGVLTLYYIVLLWIAHLAWLIWYSHQKKESIFKTWWFKSYILSIALFIPWLPIFISQISNGALAQISQSMTVDNILGVVSFNFVYRPIWQLDTVYSLIILSIIAALIYLGFKVFKNISKKQRPYLILIAMYIGVPIAILTLVGIFKPMYTERYISHVILGGLIFIGVAASSITEKSNQKAKILVAALMCAMIIGVIHLAQVGNYNFQRLQKPDVKQAAAVMSGCGPNRVVLATDPYVATELGYYLTKCEVNFYNKTASLSGGYAPLSDSPLRITDPAIELKSAKSIYYAYYGDSSLDMPSGSVLVGQHTYGGLNVDEYLTNQ